MRPSPLASCSTGCSPAPTTCHLALSVNGTGPLADWHGRVNASAGTSAHLAADVTLSAADETILGISGTAGIAPLLPTEVGPLVGDEVALSRARET